ncbi:MAG: DsbA family protein [Coriobacteriaceae bacterium]|nr:DsbA family protein [Coriobacteriaceae bacterium]
MDKVVITQFSDPMMGLSWECEPAIRRVEEKLGDAVEIRDCMAVLVRDVAYFMTPAERAMPEEAGICAYNARLAQIYLSEVPIGGVPMNMEGFSLFAPGRRASLPLCLAYEAAKLADPGKARAFLHRLREATVLECRPTTKLNEIMRVVRICGIDEGAFLERFEDGAALAALEDDQRYKESLGIWALPAFLVECGGRAALIRGAVDFEALMRAITSVADETVQHPFFPEMI